MESSIAKDGKDKSLCVTFILDTVWVRGVVIGCVWECYVISLSGELADLAVFKSRAVVKMLPNL